jgi:hypothetical protein
MNWPLVGSIETPESRENRAKVGLTSASVIVVLSAGSLTRPWRITLSGWPLFLEAARQARKHLSTANIYCGSLLRSWRTQERPRLKSGMFWPLLILG